MKTQKTFSKTQIFIFITKAFSRAASDYAQPPNCMEVHQGAYAPIPSEGGGMRVSNRSLSIRFSFC